jgi:hypothetical protein
LRGRSFRVTPAGPRAHVRDAQALLLSCKAVWSRSTSDPRSSCSRAASCKSRSASCDSRSPTTLMLRALLLRRVALLQFGERGLARPQCLRVAPPLTPLPCNGHSGSAATRVPPASARPRGQSSVAPEDLCAGSAARRSRPSEARPRTGPAPPSALDRRLRIGRAVFAVLRRGLSSSASARASSAASRSASSRSRARRLRARRRPQSAPRQDLLGHARSASGAARSARRNRTGAGPPVRARASALDNRGVRRPRPARAASSGPRSGRDLRCVAVRAAGKPAWAGTVRSGHLLRLTASHPADSQESSRSTLG